NEGRAGTRGALVIGAPPGEPELLLGAREADREQVAILNLGLLAGRERQGGPGIVGEQRTSGVATGEVAVLERADEEMGDAPGARPVRADHAHAPLGRALPHRDLQ